MTGAVLPLASDCVIPVEQYEVADGYRVARRRTWYRRLITTCIAAAATAGRARCCCRAERCCAPPEIAVAASAGMARVRVSSQPAVMVVSTGDELIEPGDPICGLPGAPLQCLRSGGDAAPARLRAGGRRSCARRRGDAARAAGAASDHARGADPERRRIDGQVRSRAQGRSLELGVQQVFHNIAQRPGKPMWFGIGPQGQAVFGLPGNPVSTLVCLIRYVIPAIAEAMGTRRAAPERLALAAPVTFQHAAHVLPAGHHRARRLGPPLGQSAAAQRLGRFLEPGRHRWLRRAAPRTQYLRRRASSPSMYRW